MPEGPEIHLEADKIRGAVGGGPCQQVFFYHEALKPYEQELAGRRIEDVQAYGKGLLICFEDDRFIYSHNQLYGKWYIKPAGKYPDTKRSLRLLLQNEHYAALLYSASEIQVLDSNGVKTHPYLSSIGPDILRCDGPEPVLEQCRSKAFRNRSFSALLLDQRFMGGIGNYLRSEILHHARLHHDMKPAQLTDDQLQQFAASTLLMARRSYENNGITNEPGLAARLKAQGYPRRAYRHYVFGRDGQECYTCGGEIMKLRTGGRRLYLCPACQKFEG
ncbi:MAG: endonuclease VIII [Cyclonatronaceae bacterium]